MGKVFFAWKIHFLKKIRNRDRKSKHWTTRPFFIKFHFLPRRFCSTCPVFMIRCALHSPDPRACFEKLKHGYRMYRKFFRDVWSRVWPQKTVFSHTILELFLTYSVKIHRMSVFTAPFFSYVSCVHDSMCATFPRPWGMFWKVKTYVYDV